MSRAEEWPVASEEVAEERAFRDNEKDSNDRRDNMACSIEEEELVQIRIGSRECNCSTYLGDDECLHEHDNATGHY